MAVEHIVLFKWKANLPAAQLARQVAGLHALRTRVPNLTSIVGGKPFRQMPDDADWDYAVIMVFPSQKELDHWATCEDHAAYAKTIMPDVERFLVVDFER